jgi:transcriptional regulator with PAS, ATPase and Fis domain
LIGSSDALNSLKERAAYAAEGDSTVLLLGETGVGKEVVARYIHAMSPRWARPFEAVNCAAIPDPLFESELFGYAPGAFTGAKKTGKPGKFQIAQSGTIFLDEVGRLSLQNQAKILRILEEGEFQRLGDASKGHVDVRLLAATNISLEEAIEQDVFLKDLYFRLAVIPLRIPPLRERLEDIPSLIAHFVANLERVLPHANFFGFSDDAISFLMEYSWPGNVRQLRNAVEYAMNIVRGRQVQPDDLHTIIPGLNDTPVACAGAHTATASGLKAAETQCIRQALETFGHTTEGKRQAARHLGIGLSTLYRKLAAMRASACVENRPGDSGWMDDVGR